MKSTACLLLVLLTPMVSSANLLANPGFNQGMDNLDGWEGYDLPTASVLAPANFVTVSAGTAQVRGYGTNSGETAFYQTYTVSGGVMTAGLYAWSATLTNVTDAGARMFIKAWTNDAFEGFRGDKFQNVAVSNGTMTLTYVHTPGDLVQFGFGVYTTNVLEGFDVSNPSLLLLAGEHSITARISLATGTPVSVSVPSQPGVSYTLEATTNLAAPMVEWQALQTMTGNGGILSLEADASALPHRSFRVVTP